MKGDTPAEIECRLSHHGRATWAGRCGGPLRWISDTVPPSWYCEEHAVFVLKRCRGCNAPTVWPYPDFCETCRKVRREAENDGECDDG